MVSLIIKVLSIFNISWSVMVTPIVKVLSIVNITISVMVSLIIKVLSIVNISLSVFFVDKIATIRSNLATMRESHIEKANKYHDSQCESTRSDFSPVTEQDVRQLIPGISFKNMFIGSYTNMADEGMHGPTVTFITKIVNLSLSTSRMPEKLKDAILSPIIKKALMDSEILTHFRTLSNLAFISKLIEKVVTNHMDCSSVCSEWHFMCCGWLVCCSASLIWLKCSLWHCRSCCANFLIVN